MRERNISQSWSEGGFGEGIIDALKYVTAIQISTLIRMKEEYGVRSLVSHSPTANIAPDEMKEVYLTKVEVNHGSLL